MIIAVDFDGTLCTDKFPEIGEPNLNLIRKLKHLSLQGHRLILWTCRCGDELQAALDWCDRQKLFFDAVNDNVYEIKTKYETSGRKVTADVYIDDKAIMPEDFNSWWLINTGDIDDYEML